MDEVSEEDTCCQKMKHPHIPLYTGDWMKDTELSLCHPATRGVWIDLLCAMHERNRSGELRGTSDQLARLARCSTVELESALTDLQTTGAALVEQRNGIWWIANRRMKREADTREKRKQSGRIGGSQTQANREQTPYDNDVDNDNEALQRVREFAREKGIVESDADWFFWKCKGNGWTNRGEPIRDWKATLFCWFRAGFLPTQKQGRNGQRHFSYRNGPEETPDQRKDRTTRASQQRQENEAAETQQTDEIQRQKVLVLAKTEIEKLRDQFKMP